MAEINFTNKCSNNEPGVLAELWRKIVNETHKFGSLKFYIDQYTDKKNKNAALTVKTKNKGTLIADVSGPEMSIKTFFYLLFNILSVKKIRITLEILYADNTTSVHTHEVDNAKINNPAEEDKSIASSLAVFEKIREEVQNAGKNK